MKAIGYISTFLIGTALSAMWNGYVLSVLWRWFIVPPFGAPALSVGYAIGIACVVGYLTKNIESSTDEEKSFGEKMLSAVFIAIFKPAIALLFGWIVTLFI